MGRAGLQGRWARKAGVIGWQKFLLLMALTVAAFALACSDTPEPAPVPGGLTETPQQSAPTVVAPIVAAPEQPAPTVAAPMVAPPEQPTLTVVSSVVAPPAATISDVSISTPSPQTSVPTSNTDAPTDTALTPAATPAPAGPCEEYGDCGLLEPGGQLTAATWLDDDRMYLADWEGRVQLLNVETGEVETVLEGLSVPQGLTVLDGRLYVSDMGNVCGLFETEQEITQCRASDRSSIDLLSRSSAQILSYRIGQDGALTDRQVVVDKLLSVGRDHSPNGLVNDGEYVYVSIGHPAEGQPQADGGHIIQAVDQLAAAGGRTDLMGTIARFRPNDAGQTDAVEVYATGLRNTYGISIGPDGMIYGADNDTEDGLATEGQLEEVNAIVEGGFYGYPYYGTNEAPPEAGVTEPVAVLQGTASTVAYANEQGVYVAHLAIGAYDNGFVIDRFDYETFTPTRIFNYTPNLVTAILERDGLLYLVTFSGQIQIIDPQHTDILDSERRARQEIFTGRMDKIIGAQEPVISSSYAVYIEESAAERNLIYVQNPCQQEDLESRFFVHIDPVDRNDLPEFRQEHGFDNLDFIFGNYGQRIGNRCIAVRQLPDYDIIIVRTGRGERWQGVISLE